MDILKTLIDILPWPKVAPFVQITADAIRQHPREFALTLHAGEVCTVNLRDPESTVVPAEVADQGIGVRVDLLAKRVSITTYYFDDIQLNWREREILRRALENFSYRPGHVFVDPLYMAEQQLLAAQAQA